jgi:metal-responsive CopG/Arc/MetJ family transcriptional regulator
MRNTNMKRIQIRIDKLLLAELDAHEHTRVLGRSAVIRRAAAEYLRRRRAQATSAAYRRAYAAGAALEDELRGWPDESAWPRR